MDKYDIAGMMSNAPKTNGQKTNTPKLMRNKQL